MILHQVRASSFSGDQVAAAVIVGAAAVVVLAVVVAAEAAAASTPKETCAQRFSAVQFS